MNSFIKISKLVSYPIRRIKVIQKVKLSCPSNQKYFAHIFLDNDQDLTGPDFRLGEIFNNKNFFHKEYLLKQKLTYNFIELETYYNLNYVDEINYYPEANFDVYRMPHYKFDYLYDERFNFVRSKKNFACSFVVPK